MNTYYNVEIQTEGKKKITAGILVLFEDYLGLTDMDLDEREDHRATFFFVSDMKASEVQNRVRTIYRYEYEMTPDRFVCWNDGHTQEYTGHVFFEEDK